MLARLRRRCWKLTHVRGCNSLDVELASRMLVLTSKISLYKIQSNWICRRKICPKTNVLIVPKTPIDTPKVY